MAVIVVANGAGNEIEKTADGFSFEFGIDPKEPRANEKTTMSLSVHNASTGEPLDIENLWIRVSKGNDILFSSSDFRVKKESTMFFSYIFKESGNYEIDFSIKYGNRDVRADFTVNVERSNKTLLKNLVIFILIFVFGYATSNIFNKTKSKNNE